MSYGYESFCMGKLFRKMIRIINRKAFKKEAGTPIKIDKYSTSEPEIYQVKKRL